MVTNHLLMTQSVTHHSYISLTHSLIHSLSHLFIQFTHRDEAGATMPAYYRTRGSLSPSSSPKHRQLQPPQKPPSLATTSHAHNGYSRHQRGVVKKPLTTSLSDGAQLTSPKSLSERHFTFDEREEMAEAELSWDTVMGDITSYCR